jgi:hypothetical protein
LYREFSFILMKFLRLLIALLLIPPCFNALLCAQNVEVKWAENPNSSRTSASGLIGRTTNGFYTYRLHKEKDATFLLEFCSYDNYSPGRQIEIALPEYNGNPTTFEKILLLNGHFLLFTSFFDSANDRNLAFASMLSAEGKYTKQLIEVDEISDVTHRKNTGHFAFRLSPDSLSLLAFHNTPFIPGEKTVFSVKLFDSELNQKWQKTFRMPYDNDEFEVVTALTDNESRVFMICRTFGPDNLRGNNQTPNKKYTLIVYNHAEKRLTEFEINVDQKWVHSARFALANDTLLVASGFYSGSAQGSIAGTFYVSFDSRSGDPVSTGFESLPREVLLAATSRDELLFGGLPSFTLREMIPLGDGSVVLVAEKEYITTSSYFDPYTGQRLLSYFYHDDDILVSRLDASGKTAFTQIIPKSQTSTNAPSIYASVGVNQHGGKTWVFFNDHPANPLSNRQPGNIRTVSNFSRTALVTAAIDSTGNVQMHRLTSPDEAGVILLPDWSREHSGRRQIIYGEMNGKDKFGELFYPGH